ncbi:uroporphyrinogen-III C-methyltransferase [Neorhodopirellula lusitana]|uniref:uroporphyrinogen-III C-methyltransferase n=1 Tax=Neorhodopirellula lusitana TaxID=445327 RepID=UPI00384F5CDC
MPNSSKPLPSSHHGPKGFVALVGAGPGHPELLTLRGQSWLSRCDVVLYDGLSNAEMLAHAPQAKHICVGKHGQSRIWTQPEIIQETLRHAQMGCCVVRLKGGDPAVFARTSEEVDALVAADINFEIVPGITAALAAGSYAGIPITHRGIASAVALVTGHEQPGKTKSDLDWPALAAFPGTLVIYMGVTTVETWTHALLEAGKAPDTPCAILRRCSLPDQQQILCRLDEIVGHLTPASRFRPPVITIVGEVTKLAETMDWFTKRPLHGQHVLVTRPSQQADELARPLTELGACSTVQSVIEIQPPDDWAPIDLFIDELNKTDILAFASVNAIQYFMQRLFERGFDTRKLGSTKLAVVGDATARKLADYHLHADIIPPEFTAKSLLHTLQTTEELPSAPSIRIVRANRGNNDLIDGLKSSGIDVRQAAAYQNVDVDRADEKIHEQLRNGEIDWVTVTSSATARNLHRLFGEDLSQCRLAAISPITAGVLEDLGYTVAAVAQTYTMQGLIDAIVAKASE